MSFNTKHKSFVVSHLLLYIHCVDTHVITDDVITDDVIVTESKADDKVRRMKLAYSDSSIDSHQSVLMWSDLLSKKMQKQDITVAELRQAIKQGTVN